MKKKALSLQTKLLLLIGSLCISAVGVLSILSYVEIRTLDKIKAAAVVDSSKNIMDKIDRNLFERYGDAQAFSLSETARSGDGERIMNYMTDMMAAYAPIYDMMIVVNAKGTVIAVNRVDKNGKSIVSTGLLGKDYSNEKWFIEAAAGNIKAGSSYVEDLHIDGDVDGILKNGGKVMNFSSPILNPQTGKFIGVWSNRVGWGDVISSLIKEESEKLKDENVIEVLPSLISSDGTYLLNFKDEKSALLKKYNPAAVDEAYVQGIATSKGYSTYPGKGWQAIIEIPKSDARIVKIKLIVAVAVCLLLLCCIIAYFNIRKIARVLSDVNQIINVEAVSVNSASSAISSASNDLASATSSQASALQETAASIEEMNAMVKKNSDNTTKSRQVALASQQVAGRGKDSVDQMVQAMDAINSSNREIVSQIEESNSRISDIIKVITDIGNKTKVINEIVFQTKLLSFNASVEAARAGEHGKGFAVVAEEVGSLAQMSGNAAKEISDMLSESIQKVEAIVQNTKTSVDRLVLQGKSKVDAGTNIAKQCGQIIDEIVQNVDEVNVMISEISTATQEQALGISEITKAMNQLDQTTNQNAATARESAESSEKLSSQAGRLFKAVSTLETIISGNSIPGTPSTEKLATEPDAHPEVKIEKTKLVKTSATATKKPLVIKKPSSKPAASNSSSGLKLASGSDIIPSENDPRFKDI